ncbi:hypothetical protein EAS62_37095 [Bradyrhizobium zhanjiangense]|uniref:Uncharacterized protein n=2 Tax=Bradyrhizobium zhanjiangense TaxID=1325107 RepID=A0ABY0D9J4_9BRAD|nr:hypothetical protein EAS62_37095 [Bradyrhizobium zhanjiangense]
MAAVREPTGRSVISFRGGCEPCDAPKNDLIVIAIAVSDLNAIEPFESDIIHFVGDRVVPVSSQAIDAGLIRK